MATDRPRQVLVIGGGPVGALTALSLHRRGWDVELWESREDPRGKNEAITNLRSINLAISSRGLEALRSVDPSLAEQFLQEAIPMKGRMIHHVDGKQDSQIYDPIHLQCINSISRPILNQRLLESLPSNIKIRFSTKLSRLDLNTRRAYGSSPEAKRPLPGQEHDDGRIGGEQGGDSKDSSSRKGKGKQVVHEDGDATPFDLIVGCDGSWSKVRSEMMRVQRMDFSQSFISHAYIELHMPADPSKPGGFAIDKNHLHIWPRHAFMLIALPNKDGSFTLTLFLPFSSLEAIKTRQQARQFFADNFPSALAVVGEDRMLDDFEKNPRGNLVTINVTPTSWGSNAILLGDASHSMVPFYGQGLNCGLEDVRVLNSYLELHNISSTTTSALGGVDGDLAAALKQYSDDRDKDLKAICELAMQNYSEMRSHVLSPMHHLRRHLDSLLSTLLPSSTRSQPQLSLSDPFPTKRVKGWTSLYEMVSFRPDIGYAEALSREIWQKEVVRIMGLSIGVVGVLGLGLGGWWLRRRR